MNLSPKYIAAIVGGTAFIFLWNALLIVRDQKMFDGYKNHRTEICQQLKTLNSECK